VWCAFDRYEENWRSCATGCSWRDYRPIALLPVSDPLLTVATGRTSMTALGHANDWAWRGASHEFSYHVEGIFKVNKVAAISLSYLLFSCSTVLRQDAMKYGVKHLTVLAEDQKVRVLRYAPSKGDKIPVHSHPSAVVYVIKGGRVKYTMPDGSTKIVELKTGEALIRTPVTHSDEAVDGVEAILVEIRQ
jgi:quercetin dioxygenase-like cupin family protein